VSGDVLSGCVVRGVIQQEQKRTHVHCDCCDSPKCNGVQLREALPPTDPSPDWLRIARMEGRAEFAQILIDQSPDDFANTYIGSHAIGDTGDYSEHWEEHKLAELFEVNEPVKSYIERIDGCYWSMHNEVDNLRAELAREKDRLDWLDTNKNAVQWSAQSGFIFWPAGDSLVSGTTLRDVIDRAREIEAGKRHEETK
jgi:hypothetical protein